MSTVGIDLGTTVSVVSHVKDGKPAVIEIDGKCTTPSVVNYRTDRPIVGRKAILDASKTVFSIKRHMGSEEKFFGKSAVEISADILSYLKIKTEECIEERVEAAVITVPAHFSDRQRVATKQAASIAGIKVLRLINEPTAAAIAFGLDKRKNGVFAVYDFGGGTFDFSVLRLIDGVFQVLATGGDNYLGGDDIDNEIMKFNFLEQGLDINQADKNEKILGKLIAKSLKEHLENKEEIQRDFIYRNKKYNFRLTTEILKKISQKFLEKSFQISNRVLMDAKTSDLNGIVLVGGMTKLGLVRNWVKQHFYTQIFDSIDPEKAVSIGAAIYADFIAQKKRNFILIDVVPLTLGIETFGGEVDQIIYRNTPIPVMEKRGYTTYASNQTGIKFHVVQGESPIAEECRSLANFELTGISPMPAGKVAIVVEFFVDVNGLLSVTAYEKKSGLQKNIIVEPSSGLSNEDIIAILEKAASNREKDSQKAKNIFIKTESEKIIDFCESIMDEIPDNTQVILKKDIQNLQCMLKKNKFQEASIIKKNIDNFLGQYLDGIINSRLNGKFITEITEQKK
ncbi:MAG: Hsp70 family protein [Holosporaceae bacterium]|jgi:molecular chaperone HscA|nr:Hsp70 family protein [Holosporaceae bacterium]